MFLYRFLVASWLTGLTNAEIFCTMCHRLLTIDGSFPFPPIHTLACWRPRFVCGRIPLHGPQMYSGPNITTSQPGIRKHVDESTTRGHLVTECDGRSRGNVSKHAKMQRNAPSRRPGPTESRIMSQKAFSHRPSLPGRSNP